MHDYHATLGGTMVSTNSARSIGNNTIGSGPIGALTPQAGEIESQLNCLDNQLKSLQLIAGQISDKFSPILASNCDTTAGGQPAQPLHTQLGSRLFTMNMQATQLRESLQDIIDRCKL